MAGGPPTEIIILFVLGFIVMAAFGISKWVIEERNKTRRAEIMADAVKESGRRNQPPD